MSQLGWQKDVRSTDAEMNLESVFNRNRVDLARDRCVATMRAERSLGANASPRRRSSPPAALRTVAKLPTRQRYPQRGSSYAPAAPRAYATGYQPVSPNAYPTLLRISKTDGALQQIAGGGSAPAPPCSVSLASLLTAAN
jgi:hypothetical protein